MMLSEPWICNVEFAQRFENWRRWCVRKGLYQGRTGSAEGAYRSPQIWDPPGPRPMPINDPDAILLNRAFWQLGGKVRLTIKILVFRSHWRPQWQAQKLGVHYLKLDQELVKAKRMMENRLTFLER
jgi:hypothetical protein